MLGAWSIVTTLPKKGNLQHCHNYRTISLISHPNKVMLKIILNRLKPQVEKIIAEEQAGFRAERSTTEQILNYAFSARITSSTSKTSTMSSLPPVLYTTPQPINSATAGGRSPFPPDVTAPPAQTTQSSVLTPSGQLNPIAVQLFNLMAAQFMNQRNPVPVQA